MFVNVSDKKNFLVWVVNNLSFKKREVIWILNYLINHEAILNNVHFIERADKTPRGLKIVANEIDDRPIMLYLAEKKFIDTDQVFHEIRMNWKADLYLECVFDDSWQNSQYLSILEDNPYARWNEQVSGEIIESLNDYFANEEKQAKIDLLYQQIDASLESDDYEGFLKLTNELNRLQTN